MLRFGGVGEVYLNNEIIGEVWKNDLGMFQCQLSTKTLQNAPIGLTMNGIGETKQEAVLMALGNALRQAQILISESERIFGAL